MTRVPNDLASRDLGPLTLAKLKEMWPVVALRHRAEMIVMHDSPNKYDSASGVTNALIEKINAGEIAWAPPSWSTTLPMPYSTGVSQHMRVLHRNGMILSAKEDKGPGNDRGVYRLRSAARERIVEWRAENRQLLALLATCECGAARPVHDYDRPCVGCRAKKAPELLPEPAGDFEHIAMLYERATGCEVIFGVTDDLERVIRIKTLRGMVEHKLPDEMPWRDAVDEWLGG